MRIAIEKGNIVFYVTSSIYLNTINQFSREDEDPFSLDFVNVYFDKDVFYERYDFGVIVFGIGFSLKVNY